MSSNAMTRVVAAALAIWSLMPPAAGADTITLGGPLPNSRMASLNDAISGFTGNGNATETQVESYYGGNWTELGSCQAGDPCNNGVLTVNLMVGSWGSGLAAGTWSIASPFPYSNLALSIHVGNGGGNPDHFVWLIANNGVPAGPYSGTWGYYKGNTSGGGLSNFKAYGRTLSVPDGGTTIALLGFAMLGVGYLRRRIA
jgi:VPDSG-CTERM motif